MMHVPPAPRTSATFFRYLRFQAPGALVLATALAAAAHYGVVAGPTAAGLLLLWIVKDLALYPLLKRAYEPSGHGYPARLVGSRGKASQKLDPKGYVVVAGELWRAEVSAEDRPIAAGETILVTGAVGTRLLVRRAQGDDVARST
jgi:membrane protein implicated in regulation of membrane protease activity